MRAYDLAETDSRTPFSPLAGQWRGSWSAFNLQPSPLIGLALSATDASGAEVHASVLNRGTGFRRWPAANSLVHLQRRYGNRYVQRVLALMRQDEREPEVPLEVEQGIERARCGGHALDNSVRLQMESAFGREFRHVRIHTDSESDTLNRSANAVAFATGQDIFSSQGAYDPRASAGEELLAYELTHVVQQSDGSLASGQAQRPRVQRLCPDCEEERKERAQRKLLVGDPEDQYEEEADRIAKAVVLRRQVDTSLADQSERDATSERAVQRAWSCGGHDGSGSECQGCKKAREADVKHTRVYEQRARPGNHWHLRRQPDGNGPVASPTVFACAKDLETSPVGRHAFFRVGSDQAGNPTYSLEPQDNRPLSSVDGEIFHSGCWQGVPMRDVPEDKNSTASDCIPTTMTLSCMESAFSSYPIGKYCTLGPNSNSFVGTTAKGCGVLALSLPGWTAGMDVAPPDPGTFSPSPLNTVLGCSEEGGCLAIAGSDLSGVGTASGISTNNAMSFSALAQGKLILGQPDDEREADQVAKAVVLRPQGDMSLADESESGTTPERVVQRACACGGHSPSGGECEECRAKSEYTAGLNDHLRTYPLLASVQRQGNGGGPQGGETVTLPDIEPPEIEPVAFEQVGNMSAAFGYRGDAQDESTGGVCPMNAQSQNLTAGLTTPRPPALRNISVTPGPDLYWISATIDEYIGYQVCSGLGPQLQSDVASDSDPVITGQNFLAVAADLTPDANGMPPRTQYWASDLTLRHELFHVNEWVKFAQSAGIEAAELFLGLQFASSLSDVGTLLARVPPVFMTAVQTRMAPFAEARAYADGAPLYRARADAIRNKGNAGQYP
jgi:hypothetical protein